MSVEQRVKQFIVENFYVSDEAALTSETSLVTGGYVDSTGMLEVVGFVETEFGVRVADTELVPENFETIARIAAFIARKQPTTTATA
jgi:acyl carrier protein